MSASAVLSHRLPSPPISTTKQNTVKKHTASTNALRAVHRHRDFFPATMRLVAKPLRPIHDKLSTILTDFVWLRFLEDSRAQGFERKPPSPPKVTYPPGLPGLDILMADLEALMNYAGYIQHFFEVWTIPLPELYDPEKVRDYFNCRPHVLMFRILEVLSSFSNAAIRLQLESISKLSGKDVDANDSSVDAAYRVGQILKETLLNLGPTFIKVGQSLSTRPDIIGSEISKALSELQDKIPPFPRAAAMKIIEKELGGPVENYFSYISEEPIAAASFGQVYQGCTLDGCIVAIKVQRPNLLHSVVRDIYILRLGLDILRKVAKRKNDLCLYADELGKGFVGELDYRIESANASEFLEAHSQYSFISVPKVHERLTKKRVLTMEYLQGESPTSLLLVSAPSSEVVHGFTECHQHESKRRLLDLVRNGVEATLVQLLETGLLHADPHPGNLLYTTEGCIGFLDFGLLCRLKKEHQNAMLASIVHIVNKDWGGLADDLVSMDVVLPGTNLRHVTMDLAEALGVIHYRDGIPDIKFSLVLGKVWSIALKYHFRMPPYFTLVLRSLASFEGMAVAADKNFRTFQAAYPYVVNKLLYDNSASTRRILYSVIFNKTREIQWEKILIFLNIGLLRIRSTGIGSSSSNMPEHKIGKQDVYKLANLMLVLLPSKDGAVLRRLLMTADPVSLTRSMISKNAITFRQHASVVLADVIYGRLLKASIGDDSSGRYTGLLLEMEGQAKTSCDSQFYTIMRDRRLMLIFYRIVGQVRRHPVLMVRACWSCFTIVAMALVISLPRFVANCLQSFVTSHSFLPRNIAVGF